MMENGKPLSTERAGSSMNRLAVNIVQRRQTKTLQIMTHQILGYPDFQTNYEMLRLFNDNNVDLVELQLPFSEPIADGPVFLQANQASLASGTTTQQCMDFAKRAVSAFPRLTFVFMTYYNIILQYGIERFIQECAGAGIQGLIVPDAFPEENSFFMETCREYGVSPILIATPYTSDERLAYLSAETGGFLYCAARKGVTGAKTSLNEEAETFLARARSLTETPLAVGFGIQNEADLRFLEGKCDMAIIGTKLLKVLEQEGLAGVEYYLKSLEKG